MSQDLKVIITTEILDVPLYIVHFREKNATIFPMLMDDLTFTEMSEYSKECKDNVAQFMDFWSSQGFNIEYPTKRLFEFLEFSKVKNIAIVAYRETLDLRDNIGDPILFVENKLIDLVKEEITYEDFHTRIGSEIGIWDLAMNEEKYWCYESMEIDYLRNLNK